MNEPYFQISTRHGMVPSTCSVDQEMRVTLPKVTSSPRAGVVIAAGASLRRLFATAALDGKSCGHKSASARKMLHHMFSTKRDRWGSSELLTSSSSAW